MPAIVIPPVNPINHARLTASIDNALEPLHNIKRLDSIGMRIARVLVEADMRQKNGMKSIERHNEQ